MDQVWGTYFGKNYPNSFFHEIFKGFGKQEVWQVVRSGHGKWIFRKPLMSTFKCVKDVVGKYSLRKGLMSKDIDQSAILVEFASTMP